MNGQELASTASLGAPSTMLDLDESTSSCTTPPGLHATRTHHPLHVNDIIQSAARSIMDESSPSNISDDNSDDEAEERQRVPSPTLRSLQIKTLPPLPDEQDRKRFVGCLAAVLAASYDYDIADENDDMDEAIRAENMAYLTVNEHEQYVEDEDDGMGLYAVPSGSFEYLDAGRGEPAPRRKRQSAGARDAVSRARSRHRQRRYDVLSKLLLSSAELLLLEKGQAKAFLPMLARLLMPEKNRESQLQGSRPPLHSSGSRNEPLRRTENGKLVYSAAIHSFSEGDSKRDFYRDQVARYEHLGPFLDSMTPGSGFRCLAMFLLQHLLHSEEGYDARVRHAVKSLGVLLLVHDMQYDPVDAFGDVPQSRSRRKRAARPLEMMAMASRKFEALEHSIAIKLLQLSRKQERVHHRGSAAPRKPHSSVLSRQDSGPTKEQIMRGLKIGGTAVVAGTLFAVTGGLAAPGIAAGVAAVAGGTAVTAAATAVLTSTAALTAIFGVGGGGLAAYKMQRRTQGLTEFEFRKETKERGASNSRNIGVDLFSTIAISGWLTDEHDFQRSWGVTPSKPRIRDRLELLERFYSIHRPDHVPKCRRILESWEGEEKELWKLLKEKYGRDPDHLFPLDEGQRFTGRLTVEQEEVLDHLFFELGYADIPRNKARDQTTPLERMRSHWNKKARRKVNSSSSLERSTASPMRDSLHGPRIDTLQHGPGADACSVTSSGFESVSSIASATSDPRDESKDKSLIPKHIATAWDYSTNYGGELYTMRWESDLLLELCDSVSDLAFDLVSGGTAQILRHTALSTLMSAIAWPYALVNAANMIDGTWTLAVERADEAGRELARSLLFSRAGHRPVTLVGYSFGARVIYSCLKELARYQELWEDFQDGILPSVDDLDPWQTGDSRFLKGMREPAGIVEDAILMGLPNHLSLSSWKACRQIVAGRLVNCFSQKDLILSLMFQFKRLGLKPVCGTLPVNVSGVENIDVSDIISGHQDYCRVTGEILRRVRHGQPFQSRATKVFVPVARRQEV